VTAPDPRLVELRARIDQLDRQLIDTLAQRLAICHEVAKVKESTDAPIIQPQRVRDVITSRRQMALVTGVDPDFAEEVLRVLLAETHRIEVAGRRPDTAPEKSAVRDNRQGSPTDVHTALDTVATRIDLVVVTVADLDEAVRHYEAYLDARDGATKLHRGGIAVLVTGGVLVTAGAIRYGLLARKRSRTNGDATARRGAAPMYIPGGAGVSFATRF